MFKRLFIFLLLLISNPVSAQLTGGNSYKLAYPENISTNSGFDISLIASNPFNNADTLEIYFIPSERIILKSLILRSVYNETEIPCNQVIISDIPGEIYKAEIALQENKLSPKTYFQLLFSFRADNAKKAVFRFSGIFKSKGKKIGYIQSSDNLSSSDSLASTSIPLEFYKSQKYAVNAAYFNPGSELNINLTDVDINSLLAEFWIKLNNSNTDFLEIINKETNRTIFDVSTNTFQMVNIKSENQYSEKFINPFFLGRGTWYHFAVLISFSKGDISFYCDNTLIYKNRMSSFLKTGDLNWKFKNDSQDKSYMIDVFRAIAFNNDITLSFLNKNYLNFIADSSRVLYQFNFDNENELQLAKSRIEISSNSISFNKSDAPIFVRAPELNINLLGNAYELKWSGGDYKQAQSYVLEKSVNNSDYIKVAVVQPDNFNEKNYSLLDEMDLNADVLYYRVKQINFDGSIIYSSQVKIGQGMTEPFILEQNYPNPFNPRTSIVLNILEDTDVEITVYNLEGKEISKIFKGFLTSGIHKFSFDASELPSGIYLYKVTTPNYSDTKKMILTK
ncbi:MAG TPA: T9SS type A sorting domain-containing protein [Ignavibacteriaceae bacterium]|nr:T9SS type A sorting domain-containing protein [Ignavibacteriaceae bacterium]